MTITTKNIPLSKAVINRKLLDIIPALLSDRMNIFYEPREDGKPITKVYTEHDGNIATLSLKGKGFYYEPNTSMHVGVPLDNLIDIQKASRAFLKDTVDFGDAGGFENLGWPNHITTLHKIVR